MILSSWLCASAGDIEAALPPAPAKAGFEPPPQQPRSPKRPALDDLSSTDDEGDDVPTAPLRSVLTQDQVNSAAAVPLQHANACPEVGLWN